MALVNSAKPSLNTRQPPKPHVDWAWKDKLKQKMEGKDKFIEDIVKWEDFAEVRKVHKGLHDMKGKWIDNSHTEDYPKISKNANWKKKCTFEEEEHIWHLKALKNRIKGIDNPVERKKNEFDPIAHPVRLFRWKGKEEAE